MIKRNTIQKEIVLKTVRDLKGHVSADEVYEVIADAYPSIGKATVYRNLAILAEEGEIRHIEVPNSADRYDFTLEDHYHVICEKCNKISDVDMDVIPDIMKRIHDSHGYKFVDYNILFKGICPECQQLK